MSVVGYIYLITNLVNGKQYVGCTSWTVLRRWKRHLTMAKTGSVQLIHKAIRKYGSGMFSVVCLETVFGDRSDLLSAERRHVVSQQSLAPVGYNLTPGGTGVDHSSPEFRAVYLEAMSEVHADPAWQEAVAEANRQKAKDPRFQETMRVAMQKMHADPKYRETRAESARRMADNPEWQAAQSDRNRQLANDPDWKQAHDSAMKDRAKDPEWRKKNAEAMRRLSQDPVWLEKVRAGVSKQAEKRAANIQARDLLLAPEERARREKNRAYGAKHRAKKMEMANAAVSNKM